MGKLYRDERCEERIGGWIAWRKAERQETIYKFGEQPAIASLAGM